MWAFVGLTVTLLASLSFLSGYVRREEIMANWSTYKKDPFYLFAAPLFKPSEDPRSPVQFAMDNFFDVIQGSVTDVFMVLLQPVFKVFQLITDALVEMLNGLFNVKALMSNMWQKWEKVSDMFMRRFYSVFHQMRVTFIKIYHSMEKSFGVAVSSIYTGLATISTVLSFVDLMIKVIVIILAILVIMMIFLFFIMWPLIPLILTAIAVLVIAGVGGVSADSFCFGEDTRVQTQKGPVPISQIMIGEMLEGGGCVEGVLFFNTPVSDLYELKGIKVSGNHIIYEGGIPLPVKEHPDAVLCAPQTTKLYCLITSNRKIPVLSLKGLQWFADWEELSDTDDLKRWHAEVHEKLNGTKPYKLPTDSALQSESAVSSGARIATPFGQIQIREINPGDIVLDADGVPTRVLGVARVSDVEKAKKIGTNAYVSCGAWIFESGCWKQPNIREAVEHEDEWFSLFTEAGTFEVEGIGMRDFTDVGADTIHETYNWVLESLGK